MPARIERLPLGPLLDLTRLSLSDLADRAERDLADVCRYAKNGVTPFMADELAGACDRHPLEVWGPAWGDAYDAAYRVRALDDDAVLVA